MAMIAVAGLTAAVVIVSTNDETQSGGSSASELTPQERRWAAYDEAVRTLTPEQLAAAFGAATVTAGPRYDGGPDEGSADVARPRHARSRSRRTRDWQTRRAD